MWNQVFKRVWILTMVGMGLCAGCSKPPDVERHLERGNAYFDEEQYEEATLEYLNVLRADPSNQVAILRSGLAHYELGNAPQAGAFLRQAVHTEPDDLDLRQKLGTLYRTLRLHAEARAEGLAILERDPEHFEGLILLVDSSFQPEEIEEAESRLADQASVHGHRGRYQLAVAQIHLRRGKLTEAETALQRALEVEPEANEVLMALGDFYVLRDEKEKAAGYLRQAAERSPPQSVSRVKWAAFRWANGEKEAAVQDLTEMVEASPDFLPGWLRLGEYALLDERKEDCAKALEEIRRVDPNDVGGLFLQARYDLAAGDPVKSIETLDRLIEMNPGAGTLYHQRGLAHRRNGTTRQAMDDLREALKLQPGMIQASLPLCELLLQSGQTGKAIQSLEDLIALRGATPQILVLLGRAYLANGEPQRALATYSGLETMQPESHIGPFLRGELLLSQNRNPEAREAYQLAQQRAPAQTTILSRLALLDLRDEEGNAAIARVEAAIEAEPEKPGLHKLLGVMHVRVGNAELAELAFRTELERSPDDLGAYAALSRLLAEAGRLDDALQEAEAALAVDPEDVRALMFAGIFYSRTEDYESALDRFLRLLKVQPGFVPAANNAAYIYAEKMGDLDQALALAKQAREQAPQDPTIADTLGWIVYRQGDHSWALTLMQEALNTYGDNPEVLYHAGMAHLAMGDEAEALSTLSKALASTGAGALPQADAIANLVALLKLPFDQATPDQADLLAAVLAEDATNPAARARRAALLARSGNPDAAHTLYQEVQADFPHYVPALLGLMDLQAGALNDPAGALSKAREARALHPRHPGIAGWAGRLALQQGEGEWAHGLLVESAAALPDDLDVQVALAVSALLQGNEAEALRIAQSHATDSPEAAHLVRLLQAFDAEVVEPAMLHQAGAVEPTQVLYAAAQMVVSRGQSPELAAATYLALLERAPGFALAAREAARLFAGPLDDSDQAYRLAIQARERLPDDPALAALLGGIVFHREDYAYAARLLTESFTAGVRDADSLYLLGLAHHHLGETGKARKILERAVAQAPESTYAAEARNILKNGEK